MTFIARCALAALIVLCSAAMPAAAQKQSFTQKAESYLCPKVDGVLGLDCFLEAVEHLYTMCRQVKSIEIIEFGYPEAEQGVNGAKTEYCVDKHKASIAKPLQAALKEARANK